MFSNEPAHALHFLRMSRHIEGAMIFTLALMPVSQKPLLGLKAWSVVTMKNKL